jgi:hypothetical protein
MRAARVAAAAEPGNGRQVAATAEERALAHGKAAGPAPVLAGEPVLPGRKAAESQYTAGSLARMPVIISGFWGMWRNCAVTQTSARSAKTVVSATASGSPLASNAMVGESQTAEAALGPVAV